MVVYRVLVSVCLVILTYSALTTKDKTKQYVCKFEPTEEVVYCTENVP